MERFYFPMCFDNEIVSVTKITAEEFTEKHKETLLSAQLDNKVLSFSDKRWRAVLLGAGEEKAVYAVCDENGRVFAAELIDERYYLNGRLIGGEYFDNLSCRGIRGIKFNSDSLVGLCFTGLVKPREFIYGCEWGHFYTDMRGSGGVIFTHILHGLFHSEFSDFYERYNDVHDRNVMFEICPIGTGRVSAVIRETDGRKRRVSIRLRGIDLR